MVPRHVKTGQTRENVGILTCSASEVRGETHLTRLASGNVERVFRGVGFALREFKAHTRTDDFEDIDSGGHCSAPFLGPGLAYCRGVAICPAIDSSIRDDLGVICGSCVFFQPLIGSIDTTRPAGFFLRTGCNVCTLLYRLDDRSVCMRQSRTKGTSRSRSDLISGTASGIGNSGGRTITTSAAKLHHESFLDAEASTGRVLEGTNGRPTSFD